MLTAHCHLIDPGLQEDISRYAIFNGTVGRLQTITSNTLYIQGLAERAFKRRYGLAMARYLRYYRLWGAIQVSSDQPSVWKHLPSDYSFVDQSHLLRDARDVAGFRPDALRWAPKFRTRY